MNDTSTLTVELTSLRQPGANPQKKYFPALDGLRAVAVVLVLIFHYGGWHLGWIGVDIFFVLSGFLITGVLYDSRDKVHRFRDFYARRTLRIFPLYYGVWLALLLATPFIHIEWRPENLLWPLYLGNWIPWLHVLHPLRAYTLHVHSHPHGAIHPFTLFTGHFWSLCVEEQFYLLWPLAVFAIRDRRMLFRVCTAAVFFSPLLRMAAMHFLPPAFSYNASIHDCTFFRLDEFLMGGLGALGVRGPHRKRLQESGSALLGFGVFCIAAASLYGRLVLHMTSDILIQAHWDLAYGITFVHIAALGMILLCMEDHSWFARIMNLAPLRAIGRVSYGFYVFHDLPHSLYFVLSRRLHFEAYGLQFVVPFVGTLALALLSFHYVESPFLRLKTRFEGGRTKPAAAVAS